MCDDIHETGHESDEAQKKGTVMGLLRMSDSFIISVLLSGLR